MLKTRLRLKVCIGSICLYFPIKLLLFSLLYQNTGGVLSGEVTLKGLWTPSTAESRDTY